MIDWNLIRKKAKQLGIFPKGFWNPLHCNFEECGIQMLLSERSVGKTTGILLIGMLLNKEYGTRIHYIRNTKNMLRESIVGDLFSTIISCGYVSKITNGKYNSIRYVKNERKWYYINQDSDGIMIEQSPECFMYAMSVDNADNYKSGYNCPVADWIIVDEFISTQEYQSNNFLPLNDIFSTLIRFRDSATIIYLANTINIDHFIFYEYAIQEQIKSLQYGDSKVYESPLGTKIYIEFIKDKEVSRKKKEVNKRYFGFNNKKLSAIRGGNWIVSNYPHIVLTNENSKCMYNKIYIETKGMLIHVSIYFVKNLGYIAYARKASRYYEDSYIYTRKELLDNRFRYNLGNKNKLDRFLWDKLYQENRFFFATNEVGFSLDNYYHDSVVNKLERG